MGFWKKFTGFLGFGPELNSEHGDDYDHNNDNSVDEINNHSYSNLPRKGFSVPVQAPTHQIGPVLVPCAAGDGGVQGLGWYAQRLRVDEDGDVADEFLEEIFPETSSFNTQHKQFQNPKIEVKLNTKPAKARNPVLTGGGTIQHFVEHGGRYLLV